jgi:hypothetical protein
MSSGDCELSRRLDGQDPILLAMIPLMEGTGAPHIGCEPSREAHSVLTNEISSVYVMQKCRSAEFPQHGVQETMLSCELPMMNAVLRRRRNS